MVLSFGAFGYTLALSLKTLGGRLTHLLGGSWGAQAVSSFMFLGQ